MTGHETKKKHGEIEWESLNRKPDLAKYLGVHHVSQVKTKTSTRVRVLL